MRIRWLRHVPFERLGTIAAWARKRGHSLTGTKLYSMRKLPKVDSFDMLVVMGGPMGVYDEKKYPWIADEKVFIEEAIRKGKTVLGICLGAQLIAAVCGARVRPNEYKEIGWWPVHQTEEAWDNRLVGFLPKNFEAFHWHGDTFELPHRAQRIAWSAACTNQAFLANRKVLGLQFHMESTPAGVKKLVDNCRHELVEGRYLQSEQGILSTTRYYRQMNDLMSKTMDYLESVTLIEE